MRTRTIFSTLLSILLFTFISYINLSILGSTTLIKKSEVSKIPKKQVKRAIIAAKTVGKTETEIVKTEANQGAFNFIEKLEMSPYVAKMAIMSNRYNY